MLQPKNPISTKKPAGKKSPEKKSHRNVHDLPPRKNPRAGGGLYPTDPPLNIPPEGFVKSSGEAEKN